MKMVNKNKRNNVEVLAILAIIFALAAYLNSNFFYLAGTFTSLTIALTKPHIVSPLTKYWMKLGSIVGKVNSQILLTFVFSTMITPVAIFRRIFTKNPMTNWNYLKKQDTIFIKRNHSYTAKDFDKAF